MEAGWKLPEIEDSDYFYLLHLFSEVDGSSSDKMDAETFFRMIANPSDIKELDELKREKQK